MDKNELKKRIAALEVQVQEQQEVYDKFKTGLSDLYGFLMCLQDIKDDPTFKMLMKNQRD